MSLNLPPRGRRLFTHPPHGIGAFETRHLEVLVADLVGARSLHDSLDAAGSVELVVAFVGAAADAIAHGDGVLDAVEGDSILALFPRAGGGTRAALRLAENLRRLGTVAGPPRARIGVAEGPVTLVVAGHPDDARIVLVGEAVPRAFALERAARETEGLILVEPGALKRAADDDRRPFGAPSQFGDEQLPAHPLRQSSAGE